MQIKYTFIVVGKANPELWGCWGKGSYSKFAGYDLLDILYGVDRES